MARTTFSRIVSDGAAVATEPVPLVKRSLSDSAGAMSHDTIAPKRPLINTKPPKSCLKVKSLKESLQNEETTHRVASRKQSCIHFSTIEIRLYHRRVGDNPSVPDGPPLSMDWNCFASQVLDLNDYEEKHPTTELLHKNEMLLSALEREDWLREAGHSSSEIFEATRLATKARNQRLSTVKKLIIQAQQEETKRRMKRGVRKVLRMAKPRQEEEETGLLKVDPSNYVVAGGSL